MAARYPQPTVRCAREPWWLCSGTGPDRSPRWPARRTRGTVTTAGLLEESAIAADQPDITIRVIDGVRCTDRDGIATRAGWKPGNSASVRAVADPAFPRPIRGQRIDRKYWYPIDGEHGVTAYLAVLAERAAAKKPPTVRPGDPHELLNAQQAAEALHIRYSTFRSYVRHSIPYWTGQRTGRPLLPPPDVQTEIHESGTPPYTRREWYRHTLTQHQALRPGPGTGAGRPRR